VQLDQIIPWGRSFDEYRRIFKLTDADLRRTILGCADGPASFNAEATVAGVRITSCDPAYAFSAEQIRRRVEACYDPVISQVWNELDRFVWKEFANPDVLGRARLAAMERFLTDFDAGKLDGRYVTASLPGLPFADGQFELCLCSHLLFLYSDKLDAQFHQESIADMLRVANEVRVFPLLNLDGNPSVHLEPVLDMLRQRDLQFRIEEVDYELQRGGNRMLQIKLK
jgi:hypothetical protein